MTGKLLAQVNIGDLPLGTTKISSRYTDFASLISLLVKNSFTLIGIILVILLIFGGFNFIIAAGNDDPKKTQQASNTIKAALIGFVVVFLSYVIVQVIETFTGLTILE
jgi:Na+/melibiose symporter-like transporter